ncbi:magnesium chelatase domain-containing protein [Candidatus Rickettsia barbariae]
MLSSIGLALHTKKILINLVLADLVKEGSNFNLAIACAILTAMNILSELEIAECWIIGELSLDDSSLPVSGALPAAIGASVRGKGLICSSKNSSEVAWSGNNILVAGNLIELVNHFKGSQVLTPPEAKLQDEPINYPDFKDIKGQKIAKQALEITASGGITF